MDRRKVIDGKQILTPAEWAYVKSQYDGAVATEDDAIAVLVSQLRNLRLMENTLLIVTADHGEALGERGLIDHNLGTLYQNQVHVPLMVRYPGQTSPARSDALVSQIDIMPTVLDVAGIEAPPSLPGRSLRSNNFGEPRTVFAEAQDGQWKVSNPIALGVRRAAFQGSLKYILWSNGPPELYDLASNPDEQINSYKAGEPESERLGKTLASWISTFPKRKLPSKKPDEGSLQRLKSLGYVQ